MHTTLAYLPVLLLITSLVQCSALRGNSALAGEGLVMQRIQSERSLSGYYSRLGDSGRDLVARLNERSMELGTIPSRSETLRILVDSRATLTDSERLFFEGFIRRVQQPPVTGRKLLEKYQAFSRATPPLNCTYRVVTHVNQWSAGDKSHFPQVVNCKFSRSPGTTFLSESGDLFSKNVLRVTWIFNGVEMREIEEARQGLSNEYVYVPPNVRSLYPEHHPFTAARIAPLEGAQDPGVQRHSGFAVFKDPTMFVFETPDECDGKECIVVGSLGSAANLSCSLSRLRGRRRAFWGVGFQWPVQANDATSQKAEF